MSTYTLNILFVPSVLLKYAITDRTSGAMLAERMLSILFGIQGPKTRLRRPSQRDVERAFDLDVPKEWRELRARPCVL